MTRITVVWYILVQRGKTRLIELRLETGDRYSPFIVVASLLQLRRTDRQSHGHVRSKVSGGARLQCGAEWLPKKVCVNVCPLANMVQCYSSCSVLTPPVSGPQNKEVSLIKQGCETVFQPLSCLRSGGATGKQLTPSYRPAKSSNTRAVPTRLNARPRARQVVQG